MSIREVRNPDGSITVTQELELSGEMRPVRDDVVTAMDDVLGRAGEVMHAIDPARIMSFANGGPAVWSVGAVAVSTPKPYGYALTYGMSHVVSPEPFRDGIGYELSIGIDGAHLPEIWAIALLRHLCRYILSSGNELMVGDVMPCHAPITRIPFPPQHHASMPDTEVDSIIVTPDPVIPRIDTPHGPIEVRRIVGVTMRELQRLGPMPPAARTSARAAVDPLLLTTI
ncbi:MAG: suppressor of fused domain protein [Deltaproteobacteria bacterium]|nr:suppressor of fused domain protein [Deltaproteobacteria bacterium]